MTISELVIPPIENLPLHWNEWTDLNAQKISIDEKINLPFKKNKPKIKKTLQNRMSHLGLYLMTPIVRYSVVLAWTPIPKTLGTLRDVFVTRLAQMAVTYEPTTKNELFISRHHI